jgi:hypothetical protein
MAKLHWERFLNDAAAARLLWNELGHDDSERLDEECSISSPFGKNPLITFHYEDGQGNAASCGIERLAGKYLFFGEYCAYEDDAGPFDDFDEAFGAILDKETIDVSLIDYVVTSALPLDQTLAICAKHVSEGRSITINNRPYLLSRGRLVNA